MSKSRFAPYPALISGPESLQVRTRLAELLDESCSRAYPRSVAAVPIAPTAEDEEPTVVARRTFGKPGRSDEPSQSVTSGSQHPEAASQQCVR